MGADKRISEFAVAALDSSGVGWTQGVAVLEELAPGAALPVENHPITVTGLVLVPALARQVRVEVVIVRDAVEALGVPGIEVVHRVPATIGLVVFLVDVHLEAGVALAPVSLFSGVVATAFC
jgi:hypothetical protein